MNQQRNQVENSTSSTYSFKIFFLSSLCVQALFEGMSHYVNVLDSFCNSHDGGSTAVPLEKLNELQRRYLTLKIHLPHIENIRSCSFISPFWANLTNDLCFQRSLTSAQVRAKYQGIKLEYQESRHTALDLLQCTSAKLQTWKAPYMSREAILVLLKDWHVSVSYRDRNMTYLYVSNPCMSNTSCCLPGICGASQCAWNSDGLAPRPERQGECLHQHGSCR